MADGFDRMRSSSRVLARRRLARGSASNAREVVGERSVRARGVVVAHADAEALRCDVSEMTPRWARQTRAREERSSSAYERRCGDKDDG